MSGAFGPAYGIQREDENLAALVEHSGARLGHRYAQLDARERRRDLHALEFAGIGDDRLAQ